MEGTQYVTKESILRRAREIKGIPLRNVDKTGRLATGKGAIGTVIEESWFGYTPNSESEPDFPEAGVELKVTPYLRGKNGIRAKERLVCNIINYMEEYDKTFQTSAFWHKCNTIDQVLKYVDWVCSEYAYGDYEAVEACIIAAEYPENIAAYYSEVVQRYYTLGSHPVRNKQWNSLKLLRYSYAAGELSYVDVTP